MIKTFIIDDHPLITDGLTKAFEKSGTIVICGIAHNSKSALDLLNQVKPDVVLLDIKLPDESGLELCKKIYKIDPSIKIIVLTSYNQRYYVQAMIKSGVQGYLLKSATPNEIIEAIICVHEGENAYSAEIKEILKFSEPTIYLSKRELEVLKLIALGLTNQEISEKLFISPLTADSHRKNLIIKLGAKNTASLISIATTDGYL